MHTPAKTKAGISPVTLETIDMANRHPGLTLEAYRNGEARHYVRRGEEHPCSKLTEEIVKEARLRHLSGDPVAALAVEYGVARRTLTDAINYSSWSHVP